MGGVPGQALCIVLLVISATHRITISPNTIHRITIIPNDYYEKHSEAIFVTVVFL